MLYDTHMHTPLCGHAFGEPDEYAQTAAKRGLGGIIFACHNPLPGGMGATSRMRVDQWDDYVELIDQTRRDWEGRIDVRLGLEADWLPGLEDWLARQIDGNDLHYVLGSIHPFLQEYLDLFPNDDPIAYQKQYFANLVIAAQSGLFDCLSHPDIVKVSYPNTWQLEPLMDHIRTCLDQIAATGIAMELNTSGVHKAVPEMNPAPAILAEMAKRRIPVVVGSDSHVPTRVGEGFATAYDLLQAAGYEHINIFLDRQRREIPIDQARACLADVVAAEI